MIYLDWNSYGVIHPHVLANMHDAYQNYFNPASKHLLGQKSNIKLRELTRIFLNKIGAKEDDTYCDSCAHNGYRVVYTSGATESNVNLLKMYSKVFVSDVEHPSIRECPHATVIQVDKNGQIDLNRLQVELRHTEPPFLVSYMLANHETGIISNVKEVADLVHSYHGHIHTDAVQAVGRIPIDIGVLDVDYMTIAAHKCGGPIGIGALVYRLPVERFAWGEVIRMGTVPIPLVSGMVKAFDIEHSSNGLLESMLPTSMILGHGLARLPNTTCITCANKTEIMMGLDIQGISVSTGAACTAGKSDRAHSVAAMGIDADTIRISSGWKTTETEMRRFVDILLKLI